MSCSIVAGLNIKFGNANHFDSDLLKCAPFSNPPTNVIVHEQTCKKIVKDKIVVLSAASSDHAKEIEDMIASVQHFYPNIHIIIYSLGLTNLETEKLESYCNVQVRQFNFRKYPDFFRELKVYAWKPLMVYEVSKEFDFIFYNDASIRFMKPVVDIVLPLMKEFPFIPGSTFERKIVRKTHDGMLHYLKMTQSREELDVFGVVESNSFALTVNELTISKILEPWADCALHKECMAPEGAQLPCSSNGTDDSDVVGVKGVYTGCHRYDQSSLNMILVREFGLNVWDSFHIKETAGIWNVQRKPTKFYTVKTC